VEQKAASQHEDSSELEQVVPAHVAPLTTDVPAGHVYVLHRAWTWQQVDSSSLEHVEPEHVADPTNDVPVGHS